MGEHERKSGKEASQVGGWQIKRPRMTNRDQMERGQSQGKKGKIMKRMSMSNERRSREPS